MLASRNRELVNERAKIDQEFKQTTYENPRYHVLSKRWSEIWHEIRHYPILLSPFRRLPISILAEVFLHCPSAHPNSPERNKGVLALCGVSSLWRKVAFATHGLWTSLYLILPNLDDSDWRYRRALDAASKWIQRSGNALPLSIRLHIRDMSYHDDTFNMRCTQVVLYIVTPIMNRIRHLDLGTCFDPQVLFHVLNVSTFLNTQSITIRGGAPDDIKYLSSAKSDRTGSSICPSLRRLVLNRGLLSNTVSDFPLPWNQLTHLTVEYIHDHLWIELLSSCIQLQCGSFLFHGEPRNYSGMADLPLIVISHLRDLTLTFLHSVNPGVLCRFDLPSLVTLRLGSSAPDTMGLWTLEGNSGNFFSQMKTVRYLALIKEWPINMELFHLLLRHAPDLITLELSVDVNLSAIFKALEHSNVPLTVISEDGPCLVPGLRTIVIDVVVYYGYSGTVALASFPVNELAGFIRSRFGRLPQCLPIQNCIIYVSDVIRHERDKAVIQYLRNEFPRINPSLKTKVRMCPMATYRGWRGRLPDYLSGEDYN
ncbi:hypothetical protein GALMADRAFT_215027 [Galerina marginata CBS 339.88]|uniref:F-box domain-containing protein n=1 Tax=Galerina marginata (strain CBS 339.88) TaxID=685588 RepID=A0A067SPN0_GALM3|nr:hypothetical protein GALMADRAFT_215027 [Galerina marginata CBS 339.88]